MPDNGAGKGSVERAAKGRLTPQPAYASTQAEASTAAITRAIDWQGCAISC